MPYFAKIDYNRKDEENHNGYLVENIISCSHLDLYASELFVGITSCFVEFKEDGTLRNKAHVGCYYLPDIEKFTNTKEGTSWSYDPLTFTYSPPTPKPDYPEGKPKGKYYYWWDEGAYQADNTNGWILRKSNAVD